MPLKSKVSCTKPVTRDWISNSELHTKEVWAPDGFPGPRHSKKNYYNSLQSLPKIERSEPFPTYFMRPECIPKLDKDIMGKGRPVSLMNTDVKKSSTKY